MCSRAAADPAAGIADPLIADGAGGCWADPTRRIHLPAVRRISGVTTSEQHRVQAVIDGVPHARRRQDAAELLDLMAAVTGEEPQVWSAGTIGFGHYHYRYATGQEGDFFKVGFAPRKDKITLYIMSGLRGFEDILDRLGPHQASKSTVHIKRLDDVDRDVLIELIEECVAHLDAVEADLGAIPRMSDIPPRRAGT